MFVCNIGLFGKVVAPIFFLFWKCVGIGGKEKRGMLYTMTEVKLEYSLNF